MYYLPLLPLFRKGAILSVEKVSKIYDVYVQEMIYLSFGQAIDIAWHKGLVATKNISENQYMQMCAYKTGALARLAVKMAAIISDADEYTIEQLGRFAEAIGVAFQIQDDILDLSEGEFSKKKGGRGQDITEGKRSLVVVHTLQIAKPRDRERLIEILDMHITNQELKGEAIRIIEKYDSINYARKFAQNLVVKSWKKASKLLLQSEAKNRINEFVHYLIERKM
jgi:geranylgeranyl pyrophosphate synthase